MYRIQREGTRARSVVHFNRLKPCDTPPSIPGERESLLETNHDTSAQSDNELEDESNDDVVQLPDPDDGVQVPNPDDVVQLPAQTEPPEIAAGEANEQHEEVNRVRQRRVIRPPHWHADYEVDTSQYCERNFT